MPSSVSIKKYKNSSNVTNLFLEPKRYKFCSNDVL